MQPNIKDSETLILLEIANTLKANDFREGEADLWADSPFKWIKTRPSRQVGKIGEKLVEHWCKKKGLDVKPSPDSQADLVIAGKRVEVKFSTLWEVGTYRFQQIRNQNYEYAVLLGLSPFEAHCWVVPKEKLLEKATPQHTGKRGTETRWVEVNPVNPPDWLKNFGGKLSDAYKIMQKW